MRSLVITAVVILFSIVGSVVANVAPVMNINTMPAAGFNQTTTVQFNAQGGITSSQTGQDQYYLQNINIVNLLTGIVFGVIYFGGTLQSYGMDPVTANAINLIMGLLVAFDLLMFWGKIPW